MKYGFLRNAQLKYGLHLLALIWLAISSGSCINEELEPIDPTKAQLEVYVYGALSLKPRDNILVSIHTTEQDAQSGSNRVLKARYTNSEGLVNFRNLEPNRHYWVRAKPVVGSSVEETETLDVGHNYHSIDIL
jgi:hypothetical protein